MSYILPFFTDIGTLVHGCCSSRKSFADGSQSRPQSGRPQLSTHSRCLSGPFSNAAFELVFPVVWLAHVQMSYTAYTGRLKFIWRDLLWHPCRPYFQVPQYPQHLSESDQTSSFTRLLHFSVGSSSCHAIARRRCRGSCFEKRKAKIYGRKR